MTLSRRGILNHTLSITALAGLSSAAALVAPPNAAGEALQVTGVNVKEHGALGDGNTDDTAAIHAARDAAGVGGKIVFPPGTYMVSGLTASVADQTWELLSDGAVVKMKTGALEILSVTADGVTIVGGVFDGSNGTKSDWTQQGIRVLADGATFRNVTVQNTPKIGIYAVGNRNNIAITGCTLINNRYAGIMVMNNEVPYIYDISITDNLVDNSSAGNNANGIYVKGGDTENLRVRRLKISRNTIRLPYETVSETGGIIVMFGDDYSVDHNLIYGGHLAITCPFPTSAVFSNNIVRGFSGTGMELPGAVNRVTVSGNNIDPDGVSGGSGIMFNSNTVKNVAITGNTISNFPKGPCYAILFSSGARPDGVTITGNTLTSAVSSGQFYGIFCNDSVTNLNVFGNMIDATSTVGSYGIAFVGAVTGVSITGNQFSNIAESAVLLSGTGGPFDHINFAANQVRNCGAGLGGDGLASATNVTK